MDFLDILFHVVELLAAIMGTVYLYKYRVDRATRYFVYFLWLTVFIETVGMSNRLIDNVAFFSFLKNTVFEKNAWLFNIYAVFSYLFYFLFFRFYIKSKRNRGIVNSIIVVFLFSTIGNLIFSGTFFEKQSSFTMVMGTVLLLITIIIYFFQILQSDELLDIGKTLTFYVATGALVLYLCVTPCIIYFKYFIMESNPEFVKVVKLIIPCAIIFTYTCYTIGFMICLKKNKSY